MAQRHLGIGLSFLALMMALNPAVNARSSEQDPEAVAMAFLDAYAAGNWKTVGAAIFPGEVHVYGSDLAEYCDDIACVKALFDDDQKLWRGSAHFGAVTHMSTIRAGNTATLFFNRVFIVGPRSLPVRISMTWRRHKGTWKLVQSSNVVPTEGQSAARLLAPN